MSFKVPLKKAFVKYLEIVTFLAVMLSSCTVAKKTQPGKPYVAANNIEIKGGNFTKDEKNTLIQRLTAQLDDSVKTKIKDVLFLWHINDSPPAYDSNAAYLSARNMKSSMIHLGYYNPSVIFKADTTGPAKKRKVTINYFVQGGTPTIIDTVSYNLKNEELQKLALYTTSQSYLVKGKPITKADVLNEIGRLVDLFRNNGYYKFTSDNLKVRGDTTIELLTSVSDDPFENLRLLAEANAKKNNPTIKLAVVLNNSTDSNGLKKYYINDTYIYPDFNYLDLTQNSVYTEVKTKSGYIVRNHEKSFRTRLLIANMYFKKGDVYSQENYAKTMNGFSRTGLWQSVNIQITERKDSTQKLDITVQLIPAKKFAFETSLETSYSANTNANSATVAGTGTLLGLSANVSLQNRNVGKKGVRMTNALRAGVELNLSNAQSSLINANELSFTNTIAYPQIIAPIRGVIKLFTSPFVKYDEKKFITKKSFINTTLSYINRFNFFNLQSLGFNIGGELSKKANRTWIVKPLNTEFSYLYNQSDSFLTILKNNPYLKYSFNSALVIGNFNLGYSTSWLSPKHKNEAHYLKTNFEESGLILSPLNVFNNYLAHFVKPDIEYKWIKTFRKTSFIARSFLGVGIPLGGADTSRTLPFFKQYFSGGANSMRGWPLRGIGPGGKALEPYDTRTLGIGTGDIKFETNFEYQYNILQIIPNSVVLKGALFVDIGNIWNFKNTRKDGQPDSLQFRFNTFYQQLGVSAGTGFRIDFNYFLLRFDLGFRFKRPDVSENAGWQIPDISFDNIFKRGANDENRKWRYENFNFAIGIGLPFQ